MNCVDGFQISGNHYWRYQQCCNQYGLINKRPQVPWRALLSHQLSLSCTSCSAYPAIMQHISTFFFSSSLDSPLLDFPFPKHSILTPTWLLGKSSAGPCKPSFLTFLNWGSELNSLSICPGVLSSERSNWNTFLTSSQGNPTHGQMSRQGRRPSPSVASHHHLGAEYMLLSSSPSSFPSVLYTSDETKENEQTRIQHNNFILIQIQPCRLQLWPSFYRIIKCNFHHSSSPFPRG